LYEITRWSAQIGYVASFFFHYNHEVLLKFESSYALLMDLQWVIIVFCPKTLPDSSQCCSCLLGLPWTTIGRSRHHTNIHWHDYSKIKLWNHHSHQWIADFWTTTYVALLYCWKSICDHDCFHLWPNKICFYQFCHNIGQPNFFSFPWSPPWNASNY